MGKAFQKLWHGLNESVCVLLRVFHQSMLWSIIAQPTLQVFWGCFAHQKGILIMKSFRWCRSQFQFDLFYFRQFSHCPHFAETETWLTKNLKRKKGQIRNYLYNLNTYQILVDTTELTPKHMHSRLRIFFIKYFFRELL